MTLDQEVTALSAAGYSGSIADMRRASMLASLGLSSSIESNSDLTKRILVAQGYTGSINDAIRGRRGRTSLLNPLTAGPSAYTGVFAGDPQWTNPGNGNGASSWRSPAGDLTNTGGAAAPIYTLVDSSLNNQPSLVFSSGSSQYFSVDIVNLTQTYYAVGIGYLNTVNSTARTLLGLGIATSSGIGVRSSNNWYSSGGTILDGALAADTLPHLFLTRFSGATGQIYIDNTLTASGAIGSTTSAWFSVGAGTSNTGTLAAYWSGGIAFAALYSADPRADAKWPVILQVARDCGVNV